MPAPIPSKLKDQLKKQLGFLQRSCESYDAGHIEESIRVATAIRVLVYDTRNSTSLLTLVNRKSINVVSSVPWFPDEVQRDMLKMIASRKRSRYSKAHRGR